jgi:hypothetical protein
MHGTSSRSFILVSQFSAAVQGEDRDEETPTNTSYKKKLQFTQKQNAKKQFAVLAGWLLQKEAAICVSAAIANNF